MITTRDIQTLALLKTPIHLAMGVFDGVHLGHQRVISEAVSAAKTAGELSGVLTFDPFPIQIVAPDRAPQKILASIAHKEALLEKLGVDVVYIIPFDQKFASLTADEFLDTLFQTKKLTHISVGEDWKFGRDRKGRLSFLREYCEKHGVQLTATPPIMQNEERISSTRIRQAVRDGNLHAAAQMLGRPYELFGTVVKGEQLGRQLGYPTANIDTTNELLPPNGVYTVQAQFNDRIEIGVANLGVRPTVSGELKKTFEVHLFDFDEEIYGKELQVSFGKRIRGEQKFPNLEALTNQIAKDCKIAQTLVDNGTAWYR